MCDYAMCDYKGNLVAWLDGELTAEEAAAAEQHVQACAACQERVAAYSEVSRGFAAMYAATNTEVAAPRSSRRVAQWTATAVAVAAAAVLALILVPRGTRQAPVAPQVAKVEMQEATPAHPEVKLAEPVKEVRSAVRRRSAPVREQQPVQWAASQPSIEIAIPADAMFPPGAVPEGVSYLANVSFSADGSVQGVRLQR